MRNSNLILIILIFFGLKSQGQTTQTYQGVFETRQTKGKATYQYIENSNYERVYVDNFKYVADKNTMLITGTYQEGVKDGTWKYSVTNFPVTAGIQNATASGNYELGKMDGIWTYSCNNIQKFMNVANNQKVNSKVSFFNGVLTGQFEYSETNTYGNSSLAIKGKFDENGLFDSTWIVKKREKGLNYENIRKYISGILYFNLYRNSGTGEILAKEENTLNLNEFFGKYNEEENVGTIQGETYYLEPIKYYPSVYSNDLNRELYKSICFWKNNHLEFFGTGIIDPINYQFEVQQGTINTVFYPERKIIIK